MAETMKGWNPKLICSIALPSIHTRLRNNYMAHYYKGNVNPINSKTAAVRHYNSG